MLSGVRAAPQLNVKHRVYTPQPFKTLALACKFISLAYWLFMAWTVIPTSLGGLRATSNPFFPGSEPDWGTPAYTFRACFEIAVLLLLSLLSAIPNRWLVGSPLLFVASLIGATSPLALIFFRPEAATSFCHCFACSRSCLRSAP